MDREGRRLTVTLIAVALALVLGAGVALLATSGGDDEEAGDTPERSSTTSSAPASTTTTSVVPRSVVTVSTAPPPSVVVVPPSPSTTPEPKPPKATTTTAPAPAPQEVTSTTAAPATTSTTTTAPPVLAPGVTDDHVRLAVVADDPATLDGAVAWASAVNRRGGLAGRTVTLDVRATDDTPEGYGEAVAEACDRSFALVATRSLHDADATPFSCGIPDVAVETTDVAHGDNATTFAAFPRVERTVNAAPYRWLHDNLSDCCDQYVLVPADGPTRATTEDAVDAATAVGFGTVGTPDVPLDAPAPDYDALAQELASSDATFASSGLGAESTLALRRAAETVGVTSIDAWYCDARCYDSDFAADPAADGEYVAIDTVPFGDRRVVPEVRTYLRAAARSDHTASYEGLRAYVAGLLLEDAVDRVVADHGDDGLTRERLLTALVAIDEFSAEGIIGPTDVGARTPSGCSVLLRVVDGHFTRVDPTERGSLDCRADNLVVLDDETDLS